MIRRSNRKQCVLIHKFIWQFISQPHWTRKCLQKNGKYEVTGAIQALAAIIAYTVAATGSLVNVPIT